ncbi:MAG: DUF58 domain-containing protein [Gammaproteobacteria bacterium]|nr:DUF58 domain-containing protein [Gammaproteobacteria bacterium]
MQDPVSDSPVGISVPGLVRLQQYSTRQVMKPGRIFALQGGDNRSSFKGRGMEFSESRAYTPGDDIRNLDWRVMARTGEPYTKLFREERERPVFFWVDFRAPMFFATRGVYKSVLAARLASVLAWSASAHSDRVGGLIFSDHVHHELKPQRGRRGVLRMIRALVGQHQPPPEVPWQQDPHTLNRALIRLRRVARPGSLVFLLSDFRGMDEAAQLQLSQIGRRSEVQVLFIYDPLERALPESGRYRVSDGRSDRVLDTSDQKLVQEYRVQFEQRLHSVKQLAGRYNLRFMEVETTADLKGLARQIQLSRN